MVGSYFINLGFGKLRLYVTFQFIKQKESFQFPFHFESGSFSPILLLYSKRRLSCCLMIAVVTSFSRLNASFSLNPSRALFSINRTNNPTQSVHIQYLIAADTE